MQRGLLLAFLLPAFISLGLWQWRKAEAKTALQTELDSRSHDAAIAMPMTLLNAADIESLRHHRIMLRGTYDAARQVLIAAHGNSLRGLTKDLEGISDADIMGLEIPTGVPIVYDLDVTPETIQIVSKSILA